MTRFRSSQPVWRVYHGGYLRTPGRDDRECGDGGEPPSRRADRRARQGEGDGEDFAGVGAANDKWRTSSSSPERGGGPPRSGGGGVGTLRPDERFRPLRQPCGLPPPRSGEELTMSAHHPHAALHSAANVFNAYIGRRR